MGNSSTTAALFPLHEPGKSLRREMVEKREEWTGQITTGPLRWLESVLHTESDDFAVEVAGREHAAGDKVPTDRASRRPAFVVAVVFPVTVPIPSVCNTNLQIGERGHHL